MTVNKLTDEQLVQLEEYKEHWLAIGRSTKDYNHEEIEEVVKRIYGKQDLPNPEIVHCDSPFSILVCYAVYEALKEKGLDRTRENILTEIDLIDEIPNVYDFCYGSLDAHWLGFYDYFDRVLKIEGLEIIHDLIDMAKVNWWLPFEEVCFISRNPLEYHFDDDNNLHNDYGPAIRYKDGFSIYCVHGVNIPEKVIMAPKSQTIKEILDEDNVEVKRIRIEKFGWSNFLEEIGAKVIDSSLVTLPEGTTWMESLYSCSDFIESNILVTTDPSTGRVYFLEVDTQNSTCKEAQKYLCGTEHIFRGLQLKPEFQNVEIDAYPLLRT